MSQPHEVRFESSKSEPIVVATDGREQSDGAVRAGALFGGPAHAWQIVSASAVIHNFAPELDLGITVQALDVLRDEQTDIVEAQVRRVLGETDGVGVEIATGDPALAVARIAKRDNASLIICGLGRHRIVDRLLGDETALSIIRAATQPVLAVPDDFEHVSRDAVVAVDFSDTSTHALRLAPGFTTTKGTIYLVNVAPYDHILNAVPGGFLTYDEHARAQLAQLATRLEVPPDVHVEPVVRQGDPASEVLRFAEEVHAGLIALGTRGLGLVARLLTGSVATKVIRNSAVPVLTIS